MWNYDNSPIARIGVSGGLEETLPQFTDRQLDLLRPGGGHRPAFQINGYYRELLAHSGQPEVKGYLRKKVQVVQDVLNAITQRQSTLLRCARAIIERQEGFFRSGEQALRPLRTEETADTIGIHESTVSRAVREKHLQCQRGVYPLSYFFPRRRGQGRGRRSGQGHAPPSYRRGGQGPSPVRPKTVRHAGGSGLPYMPVDHVLSKYL